MVPLTKLCSRPCSLKGGKMQRYNLATATAKANRHRSKTWIKSCDSRRRRSRRFCEPLRAEEIQEAAAADGISPHRPCRRCRCRCSKAIRDYPNRRPALGFGHYMNNNSIGMRSGRSQRTASKAMAPQLFVNQTSSPSERVLNSTPSKIGSVFSPMRRSLISVKPANSNVFLRVAGS